MTTEAEILQTIAKMPESLKQELLHYAKSLLETHSTLDALADQGKKTQNEAGLESGKEKFGLQTTLMSR